MSDVPAPRTVSLADMNGRIGELQAQRDAALTRCARLAGERAEAIDLVQILKGEVDRLAAQLNDPGRSVPVGAPNDTETSSAPAGAEATAH